MKQITKRQANKLVSIYKNNPDWWKPVVLCVNDTWYDIRDLKDARILREISMLNLTPPIERRAD